MEPVMAGQRTPEAAVAALAATAEATDRGGQVCKSILHLLTP